MSGFSRRRFLQGCSAALVVGFSLIRPVSTLAAQALAADAPDKPIDGEQLDAWLVVRDDGHVVVYSGKVELGTGIETALRQIVAEELGVAFAATSLVQGDTQLTPNQGVTAGSKTIQVGGRQLRRAAATAREALRQRAAEALGVPGDALQLQDGRASVRERTEQAVSYAELIGGRPFAQPVDRSAPLLAPASYRLVGTSVPRVDIPPKLFGEFSFVQDIRLPGMLHGRVIRPPITGVSALEAKIESLDDSALPDGVQVVRRGAFLGVVAQSEWAAIQAARSLKVQWSHDVALPEMERLYDYLEALPASTSRIVDRGELHPQFEAAARVLEARYEWPYQNHDSIGPSCAVADVRDGDITVWSGTQGPHQLREVLAALAERPKESIRVIYAEASGCYGHNGADDVAGDALLLSQAVGRPVRVQWSREDEHGWNPKGPAMRMRMRGALNDAGEVRGWHFRNWTPTHSTRPGPDAGDRALLAGMLIHGMPEFSRHVGGDRNAPVDYRFEHCRVEVNWLKVADTPLRPSALRGLGAVQNCFANESFFDELAHAAGRDPLQMRLQYLDDPRARAVLEAAAERAGWQTPRRGERRWREGTVSGRGLAYARYENENAYVAVVADVEVSERGVRVTRVTVGHDCGLIINPDGVRNQVEGNVVQAISRTLKEQVIFGREGVTSLEWGAYPLITFAEVPEVDIVLIDRPGEPSVGAGEAASAPIPAAIGNAIFDATGLRLRQAPFTRQRLLAARDA
ncbi:xanthine dehydrogenase family protein molybdopterin-binding subunit [Stutzerimonas nosocomialis]|uniref:Xanthine dehydrogenase family protein molybdopterin-binding subunit n=1 Tax=Stutzerimonas nosocomialis TaxID=1056496 RepID=A0A5R9QDV5_9GAMM|nr:molybdopterin cofactor-binding domain-containing protein [Stutzerimonas nosocomialis]TLX60422.1 xanthine dehydrogenase family protein molybdopterin-binding subunit [Stutzerimonas nosocomialis]TLX62972.1 xanthine dehydrogenase family protein molybdopterin-binding subunit [Stutzerimonas nosocomialis]